MVAFLVFAIGCSLFGSRSEKPLKPFEIVSLRSLESKTYDLGNGLRRLVIQEGSNYQADDGSFQPVNPTLAPAIEAGFDIEARTVQLPFVLNSISGARRFYPVVGDKTKYVEFGGFSRDLHLNRGAVSAKAVTWTQPDYTIQLIATPTGLNNEADNDVGDTT